MKAVAVRRAATARTVATARTSRVWLEFAKWAQRAYYLKWQAEEATKRWTLVSHLNFEKAPSKTSQRLVARCQSAAL